MKTYSDAPHPGVGFPADSKPGLVMNHVDGPMLYFSDGQVHWLSMGERLLVAMGFADAEALQRKLRPNLTAALSRPQRETL